VPVEHSCRPPPPLQQFENPVMHGFPEAMQQRLTWQMASLQQSLADMQPVLPRTTHCREEGDGGHGAWSSALERQ